MQTVVTVVLLLFVAATMVYLVVSETRTRSPATDSTSPASGRADVANPVSHDSRGQPARHRDQTAPVVVAYYFHGTMRCPTCLKMERFAREAIEEEFIAEIDTGLVEWHSVNYDEPANEHFVEEYGLTAGALVVVTETRGGPDPWRNLDRIWELVGDEVAFKGYVVDAVTTMLKGEP